MILISRTYSETTPESVEQGDFSDHGFIAKAESVSFRDLVRLMRKCSEGSAWPLVGDISEAYSSGFYTSDYRTGTERAESLHYCRENPPRCAKYWRLAAIAAGLVRHA